MTPILVEHAFVTFDQDLQIALVPEMNPGATIGQRVSIAGAGGVERGTHALADRLVPGAFVLFDVDAGVLPEL